MRTQQVKETSRTKHINGDTWSNITDLIKIRKLQKIQKKQTFYQGFLDLSKIIERRASSLNSVLNEKNIITTVPEDSLPGKIFELYIDGSVVKIKCPENATPGSKILLQIKKFRNISQEVKLLINLRRHYEIAYKCGKYYGYPNCCINDFVIRVHNNQKVKPIQEFTGQYTGFVPCINCSKKIIKEKLSPHDIIKNRKCKSKFPFYDDHQEGNILPCKKHALLIFFKKMTMSQVIKSGCNDCYFSDTDNENEELHEDEEEYSNL
jgi:hypothetical protein